MMVNKAESGSVVVMIAVVTAVVTIHQVLLAHAYGNEKANVRSQFLDTTLTGLQFNWNHVQAEHAAE